MTAQQLATVAGLLADRSRAAICFALLDGRAWTVGELARRAGIGASTASDHVARLVDGGLATGVRQGRHHYVRLADPEAAQLIEDLAAYAAAPGTPDDAGPAGSARSLRAVRTSAALARARTCYDHLAGRLGVQITDALTAAGLIDQAGGFALTSAGLAWLGADLGIDVAALHRSRRQLVRPCLDWTERRPHLGGAAGAALCAKFLAEGWVTRSRESRAVRVTAEGERALRQFCGIDLRDVA